MLLSGGLGGWLTGVEFRQPTLIEPQQSHQFGSDCVPDERRGAGAAARTALVKIAGPVGPFGQSRR